MHDGCICFPALRFVLRDRGFDSGLVGVMVVRPDAEAALLTAKGSGSWMMRWRRLSTEVGTGFGFPINGILLGGAGLLSSVFRNAVSFSF